MAYTIPFYCTRWEGYVLSVRQ